MEFQLSDVVGFSLLQPLATLIEGLDYADPRREHFHSPVTLESGYAAAAIPIAVMALESFTYAAQYALDNTGPPEPVPQFVLKKYPGSPYVQAVGELFVVRDAIVHGHMWRRTITLRPESSPKVRYGPYAIHFGFGDKKLKSLADFRTNRTKVLGITIIPTRLTTKDVAIVLRITVEFLVFLGREVSRELGRDPHSLINIENQYVMFRGKVVRFPGLAETIGVGAPTT